MGIDDPNLVELIGFEEGDKKAIALNDIWGKLGI